MDDVQVGSIIRAVRIRRGMSQAQVATEAGLSRALVSQIERGGLEDTSVRNIRRVAGAVGVSLPFDPSWRGAELASLLDEGGAVTGCAAVSISWKDLGEVRSLAVAPGQQGKGLGKALVQKACDADTAAWKSACIQLEAARTLSPTSDIKALLSDVYLERAHQLLSCRDSIGALDALSRLGASLLGGFAGRHDRPGRARRGQGALVGALRRRSHGRHQRHLHDASEGSRR